MHNRFNPLDGHLDSLEVSYVTFDHLDVGATVLQVRSQSGCEVVKHTDPIASVLQQCIDDTGADEAGTPSHQH
jgi:hypothetical protein